MVIFLINSMSRSAASLVPRLSDHAEKELVGESLVSTASGSGCVTTHSDKF